jgi:hypothetical protein
VKLDVKAGEEYYLKGGTATGQFSGRATLDQIHPVPGKRGDQRLRLLSGVR